MQVPFQTDSSLQKNAVQPSAASLSTTVSKGSVNFKSAQIDLNAHKSQNETYGNSRLYSPFLAPSNVIISNIQSQRAQYDTVYMHNAARTKYYNISKLPKPSEHNKINVMA
jgi:hypothetical protein